MTIEELREQEKQKLIQQLVLDLEAEKETELTTLIRKYLEKNYHVVKRDVTAKDKYNKEYMMNVILETIASNLNVSVKEIKGTSRKSPLPDARHMYFYLVRLISDESVSFEQLGMSINRDHATALYGGRKIAGYMDVDSGLKNKMNEIADVCRYKLRVN